MRASLGGGGGEGEEGREGGEGGKEGGRDGDDSVQSCPEAMVDGPKNWLRNFKNGPIFFFLTLHEGKSKMSTPLPKICIQEHKTDPVDAISWLVVSFGLTAGRPRR